MANQIFVNPYPYGQDNTQRMEEVDGTIVLCGSATANGEPLNWASMLSGLGYNSSNFRGFGGTSYGLNNGSALVTTLSASAGTITCTANNAFVAGQMVTFKGCTSVLGLLLNGLTFQVQTASSSSFTILSASTGTGTGEVGMAVSGKVYIPNAFPGPNLNATITAASASGGIVTITAAHNYLPGANVYFGANVTGALMQALLAAQTSAGYTVLQNIGGTSFTIASALTGATGTGSMSGFNPVQPYTCSFWSQKDSGYTYEYNETTGNLFVAVGGASNSTPMANLGAGAYPAAVLGDIIKYEAKWARQF